MGMTKKRMMITSLLAGSLTGALSVVVVPMLTAGMSLHVESDMLALMGSVITASRLYEAEQAGPPPDLHALLECGYLDASYFDRVYFREKDYDFDEFGDFGSGRRGILHAVARNPEIDLVCEITWNPELGEYDVLTHGDPRDRELLQDQLMLTAIVAGMVSLVVFPVSFIIAKRKGSRSRAICK